MTVTRSKAGKATTLLLFKEVDTQNARPSKVLTTERLLFFSDDLEMESGQDNVGLQITVPCCFINPRRACARGLLVRECVCLSVTTFSATTRNKPAKKRNQQVQRYTGFIFKMAIFVKILRSKVMA